MTEPAPDPAAFEATAKQAQLMDLVTDGRYTIIGFGGGVRGTKTWGTLSVLIALCRIFPGSRWAVIRKDLERLRQTTLPSFEKLRLRCPNFVAPVNQQTFEAKCANGSAILFRGENIDKDPELMRFHGYEVNGFDLEEADELSERTLHKSIERAGAWVVPSGEQPPPLIFCTFNPNNAWPRRVFYEPWRDGTLTPPYAFLPTTIADNPYAPESYKKSLQMLPEAEYKRFVIGDWDSLSGSALSLFRPVHLVPAFAIPDYWVQFGSFDYGYVHPWSFGWWAVNEDGRVFKVDTIKGRGLLAAEIVERIREKVPLAKLRYIDCGHDVFDEGRARSHNTVTHAEALMAAGLPKLRKANIARKFGLANMREYFAWKGRGPGGSDEDPRCVLLDTPGNQHCFGVLQGMRTDPDEPEDVLKVDASPETGEGGDDAYDETRYGLASRPVKGPAMYLPGHASAWSPDVLHAEAERLRRVKTVIPKVSDRPDVFGGV